MDSSSDDIELKPMVDANSIDDSTSDDNAIKPHKTLNRRNICWSSFLRFRNKIWIFLDVPASSKPAAVWGALIILLIVISILTFMIETLPEYYNDPPLAFFIIETIIVAVFTVEFIGRLATTPSYKRFFLGIMNWIDFLSIAPYYIELIVPGGPGLTWVRVLRLARIFRIFKLGRYQEGFTLFYLTFRFSLSTLALGVCFLVLGMVIFSSFMFYAEQTYSHFDDDEEQWVYNSDTILGDEKAFFQSIPHTFWWCIVTMTTVGYGDTYPISPLGKTVASITFLGGLAIIAFPIAILGSKFLELYLEAEDKKEKRKLAKLSKLDKESNKSEEEKLAELYPFFPPKIRVLLQHKTCIDAEIVQLEEKIVCLKAQAKTIERALQLFDWKRNPSLLDIEYVSKVTREHRESNLPFKDLD